MMIINKRAVAFLDILGYKNFIRKTEINKAFEKINGIIDQIDYLIKPVTTNVTEFGYKEVVKNMSILSNPKKKRDRLFKDHDVDKEFCNKFIFSDSIILISSDDSFESVLKLLIYSWRVTQLFIASRIPIRGGIVFGEMMCDKNKNLYLGNGLLDAINLEGSQEWIGVSIDNSVFEEFENEVKVFNSKNSDLLDHLFPIYSVPLKNDEEKDLRTVNWRLNLIDRKGTCDILNSSDSEAKTKVENTFKYIEFLKEKKCFYIYGDVPLELSYAEFSLKEDKEPPTKHGDEY